ncbi:huntingtin-associated protein 40 kDa isoform X2 [Arctopsyche grandis]|uniref:huntingtin-associated protein 40 kDa isoform X2 n=1 Tax=Arctopsyche grandis TaxID=121162 RepID=UPI00406D9855
MATDLGPEFSEKYNAISNKLKKRFMRKPNVSEATDEFTELALQCEHAEQPPYAGLCYIGAARCEGSIGNTIGEAEYLLMSARQFMKAELKLSSLRCINPGKENLEAAISCYSHSSKRYPEKSSLKSCINLEVANNLEQLGHYSEAAVYYQNALENNANNPGYKLICYTNMASAYVKDGKYEEALRIYEKIDELANEFSYSFEIKMCEINRLFLYLIVQPSPKVITESMEKLIERYTLDIDNDNPKFEGDSLSLCNPLPELTLFVQSILTACKVGDTQALISLRSEMKDFLNIEQQDLMRVLIQTYECIN